MHEMALCQGMVDLIAEQQRQRGFERVKRVIVEIGTLGHVDPHALEFAFEVGAKDSVAESAVLEILEIPGQGWCYQLLVQQGEELRLKELEVV